MKYVLNRSDQFLTIRWIETPSRAAVEELAADFETARRAAGAPIVLVIVIPTDDVDLPPPDARSAFQAKIRGIFEQCASVDVVILGSGIKPSLTRAALRGMAVVTRTSNRVSVHDDVEDVVRSRRLPASIAASLRTAGAA